MVKQLIYDSCMIVKKETIISIYHDIQVVHKKHDGMIVVFLKSMVLRHFRGSKICKPPLSMESASLFEGINIQCYKRS